MLSKKIKTVYDTVLYACILFMKLEWVTTDTYAEFTLYTHCVDGTVLRHALVYKWYHSDLQKSIHSFQKTFASQKFTIIKIASDKIFQTKKISW